MRVAGIIGASGFIGSHVTRRFLADGFAVRASTTNLGDESRYAHLKALENSENLEVRELDCMDAEATRDFVRGCDIVVHSGTPFQLDVEDPQTDLLDPTIRGTINVLEAVRDESPEAKVVMVASVGALNTAFPMPIPGREGEVFTETDEPYLGDADHPYAQGKYHADQAVRRFIEESSGADAEVVSVYPVGVMGASLSTRSDSTSTGLQFLFKNRLAPNPFVEMLYEVDAVWAVVDVRDVAEGIYQAAIRPGLHGKGYYLTSESWRVSDICRMLNGESPAGAPRQVYSGDAARRDLDLSFRPASEAFADYLRSTAVVPQG